MKYILTSTVKFAVEADSPANAVKVAAEYLTGIDEDLAGASIFEWGHPVVKSLEDEEWSGSPDPFDPDNFWIDDKTGERVNAHTGERLPKRGITFVRDDAKYILVIGNVFEGIKFVGPFEKAIHADEFGGGHVNDEYKVIPLITTAEFIKAEYPEAAEPVAGVDEPVNNNSEFTGFFKFRAQDGSEYGSFEVHYLDDVVLTLDGNYVPGWYWRSCFPGCLPDGDDNGPFPTAEGAYLDATDNYVKKAEGETEGDDNGTV